MTFAGRWGRVGYWTGDLGLSSDLIILTLKNLSFWCFVLAPNEPSCCPSAVCDS